jgi:hypothetical protein
VADHTKQLEEIQAKLLEQVEASLEPRELEDGSVVHPTADDCRLALAVLKHNGITSSIGESESERIRSKIAGRIDSSRIRDKRRLVALPPINGDGAA